MSDHHHEHIHDHAYLHAHGIAHSHGHVHENQKAVINRLARALGHLEKVKWWRKATIALKCWYSWQPFARRWIIPERSF